MFPKLGQIGRLGQERAPQASESGPGAGADDLLMETGNHLLLETGDAILLE